MAGLRHLEGVSAQAMQRAVTALREDMRHAAAGLADIEALHRLPGRVRTPARTPGSISL